MNIFKTITLFLIISVFLSFPVITLATRGMTSLNSFSTNAGYTPTGSTKGGDIFVDKLIQYIQLFLEFVGVIVLIVIIYGGFLWLTAGGNEEQVTKARKWIINGAIGAFIIGFSYVLAGFIENELIKARRGAINFPNNKSFVLLNNNRYL